VVQPEPQHGWPGPPQVPQDPFVHVALVAAKLQAELFATQRLPSQQPPDAHAPRSQHG
jgi:hypothetical protein